MYKSAVIEHFNGSVADVAKACKLGLSSVYVWGDIIPEKQAFRLEPLTNGQLKYDQALYEKTNQVA